MFNSSSSNSKDESENILANISQYKNQLDEVSKAIESASEEDKVQLQELQLNLISILELSLSQLDQLMQKDDGEEEPSEAENTTEEIILTNKIDEEFEKFKLEIARLDESEAKNENEKLNDLSNGEDFESSLKELEGENVRVPYKERWGGYSYHNAVVLSAVLEDENSIDAYENPQVIVLFSQPTCLAMVPCRFFLDGRCTFEVEKCKFSHGQKVSVADLKEYKEPDRDKIVSGSKVLTLHEGQDVWHRGQVEDVLEDRSSFSVNCVTCATVYEVSLGAMFPLFADDEIESADKKTSNLENNKKTEDLEEPGEEEEEEEETIFVPNDVWFKNSLNSKLGEWEKYTKGIGSKLMAKMGYIVGTGLGPKGEGRVDPVDACVYPQGVSLDHCMRLREASNGEELWQVEKRLLNQQKREEDKQKQHQKYLKANTSVFDLINNKLGSKNEGTKLPSVDDQSPSPSTSIDVSKKVLKKNTTKELNRKNFQLSSNIEKLRDEVKNLKRSRDRQSKDPATVKAIDLKLQEKMQQLSDLEKAANHIESEQQNRRNMQKLCSF